MIAMLKPPVYRALTTHHDFDETLLQKLEDAEMWEGFAAKLLKTLANKLYIAEKKYEV